MRGLKLAGLYKIVIHWTAGGKQPNATDKQHYHYMVDYMGNVIKGNYKPEDNINCYDGKYAQHTGGGNTGAIGIAMCGMLGFKNSKNVGKYPLTKVQCERTFKLIAEQAYKYGIPIDDNHVFTHYEFGLSHPKTSSYGKIDIIYLPPYPNIKASGIGHFIRSHANWYLKNYYKVSNN